jgi:hypothetical protein
MKHTKKIFVLAALVVLVFAVGCRAQISLAAFYDTAERSGFVYHLDNEGQLYLLNYDSGGWDPEGEPCPGEGPFDLAVFHNPVTDYWTDVVVDGEGALWHYYARGWEREADPVGVEGRYALAAFFDPTCNRSVYSILAPNGKFYILKGGGWVPVQENACPGEGPFDMVFFYDVIHDSFRTSVINGAGKVFDYVMDEWREAGTPQAADGPFRITGFHDLDADAYFFYLIDGEGELYLRESGDWVKRGAKIPGEAPFDLEAFYDPDGVAHLIIAIDSACRVYQFNGEEWSLQY